MMFQYMYAARVQSVTYVWISTQVKSNHNAITASQELLG